MALPVMDVLVLVGPNDLKCATYCIKNIKQYVECRTIYVLCSQTTWNHLIHSMDDKDKSIQFINEVDAALFPWMKDFDAYFRSLFPACPVKRSKWYMQQLLKLYTPVALATIKDASDIMLVCDADVMFDRPMTFFNSVKTQIYLTVANENHLPYYDHMKRLVGIAKQTPYSAVAHHMVMKLPVLQHLHQMVNSIHKLPLWKAFLKCVNAKEVANSGASEYEIYANFALKFYPNMYKFMRRVWINEVPFAKYLQILKERESVDEKTKEIKKFKSHIEYYACHWHSK